MKKHFKKLTSVMLALSLAVTMLPIYGISSTVSAATHTLQNPSKNSNGDTVWDCVWFGSYPQAEVIPSGKYTALDSNLLQDGDTIISDSLYNQLESAAGWSANGDITISGNKYRRIQMSDATCTYRLSRFYNWSDSTTYHYFKYEPIKWRVLSVNGNDAFLLADKGLDDQRYNTSYTSVTWETATIRSWLNGYSASSNDCGTDYTGKNFLDTAFGSSEQRAIKTTAVINDDSIKYGTNGGNNTNDKIFLLSESEVYTDSATSYGFDSDYRESDKARRSKSSTYCKAMGTDSSKSLDYRGNCGWWLRSPGHDANNVASVDCDGYVYGYGYVVGYGNNYAVRPALHLNLSSSNLYSYAGTVCSDGTVSELNKPVKKYEILSKYSNSSVVTYTALAKLGYSTVDSYIGKTVKEFVENEKHNEIKSTTEVNKSWKDLIWSNENVTYTKFYADVIGNYTIVNSMNHNNSTGFYGMCLKNPDGNYIISYRGSEGLHTDIIENYIRSKLKGTAISNKSDDWTTTDFEFALFDSLSEQFDDALNFYKQIKKIADEEGADVTITGHSLGGALAAYVSIETGAKAYCIDGAVGHIVDIAFTDRANVSAGSFAGTDTFNFVNYTDEEGMSSSSFIFDFLVQYAKEGESKKFEKAFSGLVSKIQRTGTSTFVADWIQASNKGYYPMVQYKTSNIFCTTEQNDMFLALAGSHHAMSFITYDKDTDTFKLNDIVEKTSTTSKWSKDVSAIESVSGITSIFKTSRVLLGTTGLDVLKAPSNWLLDRNVSNYIYGGDGTDSLYGYMGDDRLFDNDTGSVMEGGSGNDIYTISLTKKTSSNPIFINDPSGSDELIISNYGVSNNPESELSVIDGNQYIQVAIKTTGKNIYINKNRSKKSTFDIYVSDNGKIKKYTSITGLGTNISAYSRIVANKLSMSKSEDDSIKVIEVKGKAEAVFYDSDGDVIWKPDLTDKISENSEYGYIYKQEERNNLLLYVFDNVASVKILGDDTVSVAVYNFSDDESTIEDCVYKEDFDLSSKSVEFTLRGSDVGMYVVDESTNEKQIIDDAKMIVYAYDIELSENNIIMKEGEQKSIQANITTEGSSDRTVSWNSSDSSVVSVDSEGNLVACSAGTAIITATADYASALCYVTVDTIEETTTALVDATTTLNEILTDKTTEKVTKPRGASKDIAKGSTTKAVNKKKTSIKKVVSKKKSLKIMWKKVSGVNGYQIQYSTSSKFKKAKKITIKKAKITSKTIKKLKAKKKYYVRIRTYITVNGKRKYSIWSKKKSKKTK